MAILYGKSAAAGELCFAQNRRRRPGILSWIWPSFSGFLAPASTPSEGHEDKPASQAETAETFDLFPQAPPPLSPAELHALYAGTTVPPHRYLAPALIAALHSPSIALDPAKWFTDLEDVDLSSVAGAWLRTNSDTTFEQLKCIDLDARASQLTAVLAIKQGWGYAGGSSTAGSREFVAFWIDWGSGYEYEGTASAAVHDSSVLPAESIEIPRRPAG